MRDLCVVHVGMHKTGTSSIQDMLFHHLSDERFHYADLNVPNHSAAIYSLFASSPARYHAHQSAGRSYEDVAAFNRRNQALLSEGLESHAQDVTELISGEDIGYLQADELKRMKEYLSRFFERIKIIAYLRPPTSYIQSAFQELVKHGLHRFDFTHCDPNYTRFRDFGTVFGEENLLLRPFIRSRLANGDVVSDYLSVLGIKEESATGVRENESISREALSLLYTYQKFYRRSSGETYFRDRNRLVMALSGIGQSKLVFARRVIDPILERNRDGLAYVESHMGTSLPDDIAPSANLVAAEDDLLEYSDDTINKLRALIGENHVPPHLHGRSPQEVAELVEALDIKLNRVP